MQALQDISTKCGETAFTSNSKILLSATEDVLGTRKVEISARHKIKNLLRIAIIELNAYQQLKITLPNQQNHLQPRLIEEIHDYGIEQNLAEMIIACFCQFLRQNNVDVVALMRQQLYDTSVIYLSKSMALTNSILAVTANGDLWQWGVVSHAVPFEMLIQPIPKKIMTDVKCAETSYYICAVVKNDGSLWVWKNVMYNFDNVFNGKFFLNGVEISYSPQKIMDNVDKICLHTSYCALLIIKTDNSLWKLGKFAENIYAKPIKVMGNVSKVIAYFDLYLAIKMDGTLWTLGTYDCTKQYLQKFITFGKKLPSMISKKPTKITDDVLDICEYGGITYYIIKKDGNICIWGLAEDHKFYDLPQKWMSSYISTIGIDTHTDEKNHKNIILEKDGLLWETFGSLRQHNSPKKILEDVAYLAENAHFAIKEDGTLWTWGKNWYGRSGFENLEIAHRKHKNTKPISPKPIIFSEETVALVKIKTGERSPIFIP